MLRTLRDKRIVIVHWLLVDTKHDDENLRGQWAIRDGLKRIVRSEHVIFPFFKLLLR